jgi:N-acylneuraminate cytidylyltransferase
MGHKQTMKILAIIPAKLDSTRLEKKNIQLINGKTLVEHSIDYALASKHDISVIISSESLEVKNSFWGKYSNKVMFSHRNESLCGDVEVVDVYLNVVRSLKNHTYDLVVGLQPDNPNRSHTLDECIDYMVENKYDDLITINPNYKRSGSVRIFKYNYLYSGKVSKRLGCIKDSAIDIHYQEDLELAKQKFK